MSDVSDGFNSPPSGDDINEVSLGYHHDEEEEEGLDEEHSERRSDSDPGESYYDLDDGNGLLDLEAAESGNESDSDQSHLELEGEDDLYSNPRGFSRPSYYSCHDSFPQFIRLPPELRHRIWHFFCPYAAATSRVLEFKLVFSEYHGFPLRFNDFNPLPIDVLPNPMLAKQFETAQVLLSVNHESRLIGLRALPDELGINGGTATVRFNRDKDIVGVSVLSIISDALDIVAGHIFDEIVIPSWFSSNVFHLGLINFELGSAGAIDAVEGMKGFDAYIFPFVNSFPRVKTVFVITADSLHHARDIHWCGSDSVNVHHFVHEEEGEIGVVYEMENSYVWPDLSRHRNYALENVSLGKRTLGDMAREFQEIVGPKDMPDSEIERLSHIEEWPMILFPDVPGQLRLEKLRAIRFEDLPEGTDSDMNEDPEGHMSTDEDDDFGDMDGFVVDDDDLSSVDLDDEQEDVDENDELLMGLAGPENFAGGAPVNGTFSPIQLSSGSEDEKGPAQRAYTLDSDSDDGEASDPAREPHRGVAVFHTDEDEQEEEDDVAALHPAMIKRSKTQRERRVIASDSEGGADEEAYNGAGASKSDKDEPRRRTKSLRARIVDSDDENDGNDEDEDEAETTRTIHKGRRIIRIESDSEEDDEEVGTTSTLQKNRSIINIESDNAEEADGDEYDEEDHSDADEEDIRGGGNRPPRLVDLLRLNRELNPVGDEGEDEAEASSNDGDYDGYSADGGRYGGHTDDDVDDDDELEDHENEAFHGFADEVNNGEESESGEGY